MTKTSTDAIVAAARELFRTRGYAGASMKDLAERVGLQKGSLYNHVAGKEDLIPQVLDLTLAELFPEPADGVDWRAAYRDAVTRLAAHLIEHRRCVALHLAYGVDETSPVAAEAVRRFFAACRDRLAAILAHGADPAAAQTLATDTLSLLEGATLWLAVDGGADAMRRAVATLCARADALVDGTRTLDDLAGRLADTEARIATLEAALRGEIEAESCFR